MDYFLSLVFFCLLIFYCFSSDFAGVLGVLVCMLYGLMAGLLSVPAFPVVGFIVIWVGVSPLPICQSHCPNCDAFVERKFRILLSCDQ